MTLIFLIVGLTLGLSPPVFNSPGSSSSPDGQLRVFECPGEDEIFLCLENRQGEIRQLVTLPGKNISPVFSPDGLFIAFIADLGSRQVVSVTDLTGHSWPVADVTGAGPISWSPDGVWLVFSANRKDGNKDILRITAGGTDYCWLTRSPKIDEINPKYLTPNQISYETTGNETRSGGRKTVSFSRQLKCQDH